MSCGRERVADRADEVDVDLGAPYEVRELGLEHGEGRVRLFRGQGVVAVDDTFEVEQRAGGEFDRGAAGDNVGEPSGAQHGQEHGRGRRVGLAEVGDHLGAR